MGDFQGHPFRGNQWTTGAVAPGRSVRGNGDGADPSGARGSFSPAKGGMLYHGSRTPGALQGGELYLVDNYDEAVGYAEGRALTGHGKAEDAHVRAVELPAGKAVDINTEINAAIEDGDDIEAALEDGFKRARAEGATYATYTHPSFSGNDEQNVTVLLAPSKARTDSAWALSTWTPATAGKARSTPQQIEKDARRANTSREKASPERQAAFLERAKSMVGDEYSREIRKLPMADRKAIWKKQGLS